MDPFTAAMNALAAFNNFLCTPAGQAFAVRQQGIVDGILSKLHLKIGPADAAPATHA